MYSTFSVYSTNTSSKASQQIGEAKDDKINKYYHIYITEDSQKEKIIINISKRGKNPGSFVVEKALTAVSLL